MKSRFHVSRSIALLAAVVLASPAQAFLYTIDNDNNPGNGFGSVTFQAGTVNVTILPVLDASGIAISLGGSLTDPGSKDWLIFQVQVNSGTYVDQVAAGAFGSTAQAFGYINDADVTPSGGNFTDPTSPRFLFAAPNITPGTKSDRLIVEYNLGALPPPGLGGGFLEDQASFMVSDNTLTDFSNPTPIYVVAVPEPGTLALLGLGLLGLVAATPRRRTH